MKKLTRTEMKGVIGGVNVPYATITGTIGGSSAGFCLCDYLYFDGTVVCELPCDVRICDWAQNN